MNPLKSILPLLIVTVIASSLAHAANITWAAPEEISADSNVSTNGTLIGAFNIGDLGVPSTMVNGVTFQSFSAPGANGTSGNFTLTTASGGAASNTGGGAPSAAPFNALSAAYQTLLSSYIGTLFTSTLTISGLTIGMQYEFQVWSNRSSNSFNTGVSLTAGDSVFLSSNPSETIGGLGEWVRGTFTAEAATQMIDFEGDGEVRGYVNAFQLRQLQQPTAVPEGGSTIALLGCAVSLLGLLRRTVKARG